MTPAEGLLTGLTVSPAVCMAAAIVGVPLVWLQVPVAVPVMPSTANELLGWKLRLPLGCKVTGPEKVNVE